MTERKNKTVYTRTISKELLDAWQRLRRTGDPELMAEYCQCSRPVIDRALIYGYISIAGLSDKINAFFKARLEAERTSAQELNSLADMVEGKQ